MNKHKIYISHSDSDEAVALFEKVKQSIYNLGKGVFHLGEKTRGLVQIQQNWDKITENMMSCDTTVVILTKDLLNQNKHFLLNGVMEQEIKASLFDNKNTKRINSVVLLVTDEFKKAYFDVENKKKVSFPIIDNNIDNINIYRKSDDDYPGFLYTVRVNDFLKQPNIYLKKAEKIRDRHRELDIYIVKWTI